MSTWKEAEIGPILTLMSAASSLSETQVRLSQRGMHDLRMSTSLSAAQSVSLGAGIRSSPVMSMRDPFVPRAFPGHPGRKALCQGLSRCYLLSPLFTLETSMVKQKERRAGQKAMPRPGTKPKSSETDKKSGRAAPGIPAHRSAPPALHVDRPPKEPRAA